MERERETETERRQGCWCCRRQVPWHADCRMPSRCRRPTAAYEQRREIEQREGERRKEREESGRKSRQTKIVEEKSKNGNRKTPLLQLPSRALLDWLHTLAHTHNHTHTCTQTWPDQRNRNKAQRGGAWHGVARRIGKSAAQNKLKQVENKFEKINEIKRRNRRKKDKVKSEKRKRANGAHKREAGRRGEGGKGRHRVAYAGHL